MKKQLTSIVAVAALSLSFLLSVNVNSLKADPWYEAIHLHGVEIRSRAHGEGHVKCTVPRFAVLHRNHEENWSRYIYVEWKGHIWEWQYKGTNGKWCPHWNRHGWVDKRKLRTISKPSWAR